MSFDQLHDGEDNEPAPDRVPRPAPGLDRSRDQGREGQDARADRAPDTRSRAKLAAENASLAHAVGELASENADLYKRIDALRAELKASQAEINTEQDRFRTWAKAISNRDAERDLRDEARNKREEALADRVAELERRDAERQDSPRGQILPGRLEERSAAQAEIGRQERGRGRPSNELIAVGAAWAAVVLSTIGQLKGTPEAAVVATYGAEGAAVAAAHIALYRKNKEGRSGDRS